MIAVVGLLDLYGASLSYPPNLTADAKYALAKTELERRVGDPRFRQHFAVHETEAWLLSDPGIFPAAIRDRLANEADRPESVNFEEPPAKLLHRVYRAHRREYKKVVDGSALLNKTALAHWGCGDAPSLGDAHWSTPDNRGHEV